MIRRSAEFLAEMLKAMDGHFLVLFSCVFLLGINIQLVEAVNEDQGDNNNEQHGRVKITKDKKGKVGISQAHNGRIINL